MQGNNENCLDRHVCRLSIVYEFLYRLLSKFSSLRLSQAAIAETVVAAQLTFPMQLSLVKNHFFAEFA
jgi:hypothetical protein